MKKCEACDEFFEWDDDVVIADDNFYHVRCVDLYPIGYFVMLDDEPIGESENDGGNMAFEVLEEGEYIHY